MKIIEQIFATWFVLHYTLCHYVPAPRSLFLFLLFNTLWWAAGFVCNDDDFVWNNTRRRRRKKLCRLNGRGQSDNKKLSTLYFIESMMAWKWKFKNPSHKSWHCWCHRILTNTIHNLWRWQKKSVIIMYNDSKWLKNITQKESTHFLSCYCWSPRQPALSQPASRGANDICAQKKWTVSRSKKGRRRKKMKKTNKKGEQWIIWEKMARAHVQMFDRCCPRDPRTRPTAADCSRFMHIKSATFYMMMCVRYVRWMSRLFEIVS